MVFLVNNLNIEMDCLKLSWSVNVFISTKYFDHQKNIKIIHSVPSDY